jgi:hypothetical protein
MLEMAVTFGIVVLMARMAGMEGKSGFLVGGITLAACIAAIYLIPLPLIRVLIAAFGVFIGWTVLNMLGKR